MALHKSAAEIGLQGEDCAARFLEERGYQILERNWRTKEGELDIVAFSPEGEVIFLEVKSRSSMDYGDPLESITSAKAMRIQRLALAWLATHQRLGASYRIDAVGILIGRSGDITVDYRSGIL